MARFWQVARFLRWVVIGVDTSCGSRLMGASISALIRDWDLAELIRGLCDGCSCRQTGALSLADSLRVLRELIISIIWLACAHRAPAIPSGFMSDPKAAHRLQTCFTLRPHFRLVGLMSSNTRTI